LSKTKRNSNEVIVPGKQAGRDEHAYIAGLLRHYYIAVSREEIPSRLLKLLERLEETEQNHKES